MGKLVKSLGGIVLLCIVGGVIFLFLLWSRLPDMIASKLSKQLRVWVEIGDMSLSMNTIGVDRFVIHNPEGYKLPKALSAEKITIDAPLTHYVRDDIVIEQILVSDVYLGLEFETIKSARGNWSTILENAKAAQEESAPSSSEKTVFIKSLILTNINADLFYQNEGKVRRLKTIKQIELKNISSKGGNIGAQLMNSALGEAVKQVFIEENLKDLFDQLLQGPGNTLQDYIGPLKNFFNVVPRDSQETLAKAV